MKKPKKWTEVYPQGTKEGDEEHSFWVALARNKEWDWISTAQLVKSTKLPRSRVEEIIAKYLKMGMIFASETTDDLWAYWDRVPERLVEKPSLVKEDHDYRIEGGSF